MRGATYLESLDSTRAIFDDATGESGSPERLQALVESLLVLALGRSLVVQQSYALDSWAFYVLSKAFAKKESSPGQSEQPPILLHLYGADSFADAAAERVAGIGRGNFESSLFKELVGNEDLCSSLSERIRMGQFEALGERLGGEREEALRGMAALLRGARKGTSAVIQPTERESISMSSAIRQLLQNGEFRKRSSQSTLFDILDRLRLAADSVLANGSANDPLNYRGRIHSQSPFPGHQGGLSVREVAGSDVAFAEVLEFIDTLYNVIVCDSIGTAPILCSTLVATGLGASTELWNLHESQNAAVHAYKLASARRTGSLSLGESFAEDRDAKFEISVSVNRHSAFDIGETFAANHSGPSLENALLDCIVEVLRNWANPVFVRSANALDDAARQGNLEQLNFALAAHGRLIGQILGGKATFHWEGPAVILLVRAASAGISSWLKQELDVSQIVNSILEAAAASLPFGHWTSGNAVARAVSRSVFVTR
ncbi:hypothetical protein [Nostocoides jenkinsii]|uniref:Uncharacterized protein n=1 Tax=Nostocoides jenkinsii Ben 74 TaxID=1193518 RepID=A0A077M5S8_9MICO|nr:hypothetical protein [Tetrasphaera jenkinsii]CCI52666.1 hypothetical protein BN13_1940003 [Tetrasphaera jenkinsii Ben 74]